MQCWSDIGCYVRSSDDVSWVACYNGLGYFYLVIRGGHLGAILNCCVSVFKQSAAHLWLRRRTEVQLSKIIL